MKFMLYVPWDSCFWLNIFLLSNHCCDKWKIVFFLFPWQSLLGKQILSSQSWGLSIQTTVPLKNWIQTYKDYSKNCCKSVSSISKDWDPKNGIKMQQKLVFEFLLPLVIYLSGFHLLNVSYFSQNFVMTSLDILFSGTPWRNYIKW